MGASQSGNSPAVDSSLSSLSTLTSSCGTAGFCFSIGGKQMKVPPAKSQPNDSNQPQRQQQTGAKNEGIWSPKIRCYVNEDNGDTAYPLITLDQFFEFLKVEDNFPDNKIIMMSLYSVPLESQQKLWVGEPDKGKGRANGSELLSHHFVVVKIGKYFLSLDKFNTGVIVQLSEKQEHVTGRVGGSTRIIAKCESQVHFIAGYKMREAKKTVIDLVSKLQGGFFSNPYDIVTSNCQHFAKGLMTVFTYSPFNPVGGLTDYLAHPELSAEIEEIILNKKGFYLMSSKTDF